MIQRLAIPDLHIDPHYSSGRDEDSGLTGMAGILVLTGASGSGKTTLLRALEAMEMPGLACFQCDTIYGDLPDAIRADGEAAQDAMLEHWVKHALDSPALNLAVLDTQIRPQRALAMFRRLGTAT